MKHTSAPIPQGTPGPPKLSIKCSKKQRGRVARCAFATLQPGLSPGAQRLRKPAELTPSWPPGSNFHAMPPRI